MVSLHASDYRLLAGGASMLSDGWWDVLTFAPYGILSRSLRLFTPGFVVATSGLLRGYLGSRRSCRRALIIMWGLGRHGKPTGCALSVTA